MIRGSKRPVGTWWVNQSCNKGLGPQPQCTFLCGALYRVRLIRSVANECVSYPVVEQHLLLNYYYYLILTPDEQGDEREQTNYLVSMNLL